MVIAMYAFSQVMHSIKITLDMPSILPLQTFYEELVLLATRSLLCSWYNTLPQKDCVTFCISSLDSRDDNAAGIE